jgi:predicted DNA-binding transcriptional regulator AlpA
MSSTSPLLPKRAVAERLDIHPNSVPKLVERGLLTAHRTPRGLEYPLDEVKLLQRRIGATRSDQLLNAAQAAAILGVHRNTVNLLYRRGDLKGRHFPGSDHLRYRESDVRALANSRAKREALDRPGR